MVRLILILMVVVTQWGGGGPDHRIARGALVATAGRSGNVVGWTDSFAPAPIYTVYLSVVYAP